MSKLLDQVAQALENATSQYEDGSLCLDWNGMARAAIEAIREPTEEMLDDAWAWQSREDGEYMTNIWQAMIDWILE